MKRLSRRRVLRGMLNGAAVSVALPLLDCFLNDNGTAMAGNAPLPLRFGTWTWGLGMSEAVFVPRPGATAEDDGWLCAFVTDRASERSELVVLDARDVEGEPVARVHLRRRVPFGFHCGWAPLTRAAGGAA